MKKLRQKLLHPYDQAIDNETIVCRCRTRYRPGEFRQLITRGIPGYQRNQDLSRRPGMGAWFGASTCNTWESTGYFKEEGIPWMKVVDQDQNGPAVH